MNNLGVLHGKITEYKKALEFYLESKSIAEAMHEIETPDYLAILINIGTIRFRKKMYSEAAKTFEELLPLANAIHGPQSFPSAILLNNLGLALSRVGHYKKAVNYLLSSLEIRKSLYGADNLKLSNTLENIANAYRHIDKKLAIKYLNEMIKIQQTSLGENYTNWKSNQFNLARLYEDTDKIDHAQLIYKKIINANNKPPDNTRELTTYIHAATRLAGINREKGDLKASLYLLLESLSLSKKLDYQHNKELNHFTSLTYAKLVDHKSATYYSRKTFQLVLEEQQDLIKNNIGLLERFSISNSVYTENHLNNIFNLIKSIEKHKDELKSEAFKTSQFFELTNQFVRMQKGTIKINSDEETANFQNKYNQLIVNIISLNNEIFRSTQLDHQIVEEESNKLSKKYKDLIKEKNGLAEKLDLLSPSWKNYLTFYGFETSEIQNKLLEHEALVFYIMGKKIKLAWFVTNSDYGFVKLDFANDDYNLITNVNNSLKVNETEGLKGIPLFDTESSKLLYNKLMFPILSNLNEINSLIISPGSKLEALPFSSLVISTNGSKIEHFSQFGNYRKYTWLNDLYSLSFLPSIHNFISLRSKDRIISNTKLLAIGDPKELAVNSTRDLYIRSLKQKAPSFITRNALSKLPNARSELSNQMVIANDSNSILLTGKNATELNFKTAVDNSFPFISFATHAVYSNNSALLLTKDKEFLEDGILTADEISKLNLDAELIFLSACNVLRPENRQDSSFANLVESFLFAGAKSIIATQWDVEDESVAQITVNFFENLISKKEMSASEALRQSMLKLKNNKEHQYFSHPIFWAPVILVGDNRAIEIK